MAQFTLLVSPSVIDFSRSVEVVVNGRRVFEGSLTRDLAALMRWAARDDDRTQLYGAELHVPVNYFGDAPIKVVGTASWHVIKLGPTEPQTRAIRLLRSLYRARNDMVILIGLFAVQARGTGRVAAFFGPVMLLWFLVLAIGGFIHIVDAPRVFLAFNPLYGVRLLAHNGLLGLVILGLVGSVMFVAGVPGRWLAWSSAAG